MSRATLLHRESSSKSLKTIVETAHRQSLLNETYEITVRNGQLVLSLLKPSLLKQTSTDEGFESDVDSISLLSTEDGFTPASKSQETDSANGSACSDSDDTDSSDSGKGVTTTHNLHHKETFNLVDCICYTDTKFPNALVFVILNEALVFSFENPEDLQAFHTNFSAIKAVANQRAYAATVRPSKFNLLQRTDANGVTHIEISREASGYHLDIKNDSEPSSIISINAPDDAIKTYIPYLKKSISSENLLDEPGVLRKIWNSAENVLDAPKRPERRKRQKGPAPQPPPPQNILRGKFVRVNVQKTDQKLLPPLPPPKPTALIAWTNSMPRLFKKTKSESRLFTPMAYRYIDTTLQYRQPPPPPQIHTYIPRYKPNLKPNISNRLFGMSSKLKEFASVQSNNNPNSKYQTKDPRYSSLGNLTCPDGTLKSVIKKEDARAKKNDKKVTFSAYNTVQVV